MGKNLAEANTVPGSVLVNSPSQNYRRGCAEFFFSSDWNTVCEVSEFVFVRMFITKYLYCKEQMWLARATVRMCGRLQFNIKETEAVVPMW